MQKFGFSNHLDAQNKTENEMWTEPQNWSIYFPHLIFKTSKTQRKIRVGVELASQLINISSKITNWMKIDIGSLNKTSN